MKIKNRKFLAGIMCMALILGNTAMPATHSGSDQTVTVSAASVTTKLFNGFEYYTKKDGTVEISKYIGKNSQITVPSEIYGKKVTSLGSSFLQDNKKTLNVTVSGNVTEIKAFAFAYSSVQNVKLNKELKTIGDSAFNLCQNLKTINIPTGVTTIGKNAFFCNYTLEKISIPDTVTQMGSAAFYNCANLKDIKLSKNCTTIPNGAFELFGYSSGGSLATVTIPETVTKISDYAFKGRKFRVITIPKNVKSIGHQAIGYDYWNKPYDNLIIYGFTRTAEEYAFSNGLIYKDRNIGDVNGDGMVNVTDISMIAAHIKGIKVLTEEQQKRADVNCDGKIDTSDICGSAAHIKGIKPL